MIDFAKSVDIPMMNVRTQEVEFVVQVYGRTPEELQTVPNAVVSTLADRYPGFVASPFALIDRTRYAPPPPPKPFMLGFADEEDE